MASSKISGRTFFNDVGTSDFEEVNEYVMDKNYGFHLVEGYLGSSPSPASNYKDPLYAYGHNYGCAVVGATFYEPDNNLFPVEYFGKYFFLEYCEGILLCMDPISQNVTEFATDLGPGYNNLEAANDGYLYLINVSTGKLARISYQGFNSPPFITLQPKAQVVPVGDNVVFTVGTTGDSLSFDWYQNNNLVQSGGSSSFTLSNVQLSDDQAEINVRITNPHGYVFSDTVKLSVVVGSAPTIQFQNIPTTYRAGDSIHFSALVSDPDQSAILPQFQTWWIDFYHNIHAHPALTQVSGISGGVYFVETFGETATDVFFRIHLSVEDSSGLVAESSIDVLPEYVFLHLNSQPPGIEIKIDGSEATTNFLLNSVRNLNRIIEVPPYAIVQDSIFEFIQWHDSLDTLIRTIPAQSSLFLVEYQGYQEFSPSVQTLGNRIIFTDTASNQQFYARKSVYEVEENWDVLNPYYWDTPPFPNDYYSGHWEGNILAPVSDWYTFYLLHDSKASLKVGDSLLINGSIASANTQEDTARIWLNGGDIFPIIVDYDHYTYIARIELSWSYSLIGKHILKFSEADLGVADEDPRPVPSPEKEAIRVFPNPVEKGNVNLLFDLRVLKGISCEFEVYNEFGILVHSQGGDLNQGVLPIKKNACP